MSRVLAGIIAALLLSLLSLWLTNTRLHVQLAASVNETRELRSTIRRTNETLEAYRDAHHRDTTTLATLDRKIIALEAYVNDLPDGGAECLSAPDADRLRTLWE